MIRAMNSALSVQPEKWICSKFDAIGFFVPRVVGLAMSRFRSSLLVGLCIAAFILPAVAAPAAPIASEAALRAAIDVATNGAVITISGNIELQSSIRITKRLTFRNDPSYSWGYAIGGGFPGVLFQIAADGITFESLRLWGSSQTDGFLVEKDLVLRDCYVGGFRSPTAFPENWWQFLEARVRLERVTVTRNHAGFEAYRLEATDCVFSYNADTGAAGTYATINRCTFENNRGDGLILTYGAVKNCVFRFNGGLGLRFDPDPGEMSLSSSLFYANAEGALLVREQATATIDNCTFTRHTGPPVIIVTEATDVLFRHCTVTDNLLIEGDPNAWPPPPTGAFLIEQSGRVELQNCLVADNPITNNVHASGLLGPWIDGGGNVIGGPARLGTLRDNGGPTLSMLPLADSPAIDAGRPSAVMTDARGFSRPEGAAPDAGAIEVGAAPVADADRDGLPDNWELSYGLNPADANDASSDRDADGRTALAEFQSRTDPGDPQSVLRIHNFSRLSSGTDTVIVRFNWPRVPGVTYQVETSTDLQNWQSARGNIWVSSYTTSTGTRVTEFDGPADSSSLFYRVTVVDD
jgi:hypothetical protein